MGLSRLPCASFSQRLPHTSSLIVFLWPTPSVLLLSCVGVVAWPLFFKKATLLAPLPAVALHGALSLQLTPRHVSHVCPLVAAWVCGFPLMMNSPTSPNRPSHRTRPPKPRVMQLLLRPLPCCHRPAPSWPPPARLGLPRLCLSPFLLRYLQPL